MRNLKKILALVLAMVMVLSVMVTANAAFVDEKDISAKYAEAVEVMSNVGVIRGVEQADGTFKFNPKGTLTRAQAATIIAYIMEGSLDNIDAIIDAVDNPFTDVPAWAESYVLYAYSKGIMIGNGAGLASPNRELTGYEFGKMLLIAAAVCEDKDFATGNWKLTVAAELKDAGLWSSDDFALSATLTREQACYMAFNAMLYTAQNGKYYTVAGFDFTDLKEAMLYAALLEETVEGPYYSYEGSLADDVFALNVLPYVYGVGFNGYYWYVDVDEVDGFNVKKDVVVSSFICTDDVVGVYAADETYVTISKDLGKVANYNVDVYVNANYVDTYGIDYDNKTYVVADDTNYTVTITVEDNDAKTVNALYAHEVLAEAYRGQKVTNKDSAYYGLYAWTLKDMAGETVYTTYAAANAYSLASTGVKYLVVAKNTTTALSITKAEAVIGKVTGIADKYIRVGTEVIYKANSGISATINANKNVTVYLNSQGDVTYIYDGVYTTAAAQIDGYAYVSAIEYVATPYSRTGLYGTTEPTISAKASITTAEGEILTVDVATRIYTPNAVTKTPQYYLNGWNNATTLTGKAAPVDFEGWVAYAIVDGAYYFTSVAPATINFTAKSAEISINGGTYYLNADTKFDLLVYNVDTKAVESYLTFTGYTSTVAQAYGNWMDCTNVPAIIEKDVYGVVSSITILETDAIADATYYAFYAGEGEQYLTYQYHNFIVDGELVSYLSTVDMSGLTEGDIVVFETNVYGYISSVTVKNYANAGAEYTVKSISADGSYFIDTNNTVHYLASGYVVYDATALLAPAELCVGATVSYVNNTADTAAACVVITGYDLQLVG